jgi:hypothetical protein
MGELPEQRRALAILDWLRTRTPTDLATLTVRDVQRSRGTAIEGIRASLGLLDDHGYIRLERQPSTSRGGRPSERVRVNPAIGQRSNRTDITDETLRPETRGSAGSVTEIEDVQ